MVRLFYASLCTCLFYLLTLLSGLHPAHAESPVHPKKAATAALPEEQQRYLMYTFYNAGYTGDPNFNWTPVETALNNGFNGIMLCVPWDQIYPTRNGPPNWATLDRQIALIAEKGAKVGLLIGLQRDSDRVDDFWTSDTYARTYRNEVVYKAHAYQFSPAHQPTLDLATDFVRQVAQRYNPQQQQGTILFMSVANSPIMEQEYTSTSQVQYQAGENSTVLDYSKPMIEGFRAWLTTKYTTIGALNTAWGRGYANFGDVQPPGLYATTIYEAFAGKPGKDWYAYRHKVHKAMVEQTTQAIKSVNGSYKVINQHGSVFDTYSPFRGTMGFKNYALNTDGVKVNDAPGYPHRFSMDLLRSNLSPGKWVMNEIDGIGYARVGISTYMEQIAQSFTHGAKVVTVSNFADAGGIAMAGQIVQQVRAQGWLDKPIPAFEPIGNIDVKLSRVIDVGYGELGVTGQWTQLYNQNGNKPVRVTLDEDILDQTPIVPPTPVSSLSLLAPTLDCATGLLTFKTAGGNGTAIEYMIAGLSEWSTSPTVTIEAARRIGVAFVLKARQNGQEVSYSYTTACGNTPPVLATAIASQTIVVGEPYRLVIPANTFTDSDGQIVGWAVNNLPPGLTFNADTRTISGAPSSVGTYSLTLVVTDNGGATAQTTFTIRAVGTTSPPPANPPPTNPGPANSLSMVAPSVDCATGLLTFKTAGGDGTPIEFMAVGLKVWSTSATATIPSHQRDGVTFTLKARQSGREVSYNYTTNCSSQPPTPAPPVPTPVPPTPAPTPSAALSLVAPGFDCATGKLTLRSRGGDGTPIEYMTLGVRSWSSDSVFFIDAWQRDGVTFTLQARQSGREVTTQFRTSCPSTPAPANKPPVVVTPIANQTATLARAYSFVIPGGTFTDPDGQLVKWSAENLPVGLTFEATTQTISGTPSLIGPNVVTITVTDNGGASVSTTFILQVLGNNTTPPPAPTPPPTPTPTTLTLLAPGFDCATGKLTFRSAGGDGTPVEYFAVGIKSWNRDSVGYVDPWQREGVTFTLQARQSGRQASYSFLTACSSAPANKPPVNKPPVVVTPIANQTATLARAYSFAVPTGTFTDPDGQLVKWSAENLPVGLTFEATTQTISGTPSLIGPNVVTITVTDNGGASVSTTFILQVLGNNTTPPPAPTPTPTTLTLLAPGFDCATGKLAFRSAGGDGTPVEYFAVGIKSWNRDSIGYVDPWQREGVTFTLQVRQSGRQASYSFLTACSSAPANKPPVVVTPIANQTATLARAYSFVVPTTTFTDPDGQLVKWSAGNLPVGLSFEATTRTISGTPSQVGSNVVTITVTDNGGASASTTFTLQVLGDNTPPTPTPVPTPTTLALLAPGFDCATGKLTFRSGGGDGTPVEYMALGIKGWSRDSTGFVETHQRSGVTFTLKARQSGREVSYSFTTACGGVTPPTPPAPTPTPAPTASALAVASPQNRIVYQRNQANLANVPVVGQAPSTTTRAEARLVPVVNGQGASMDWTNLPLSATKTFSTNLTHTGGWYRLEVRAWNEGTQLGQQTVDRVGIGEVFVIAGQSNAHGGFEVRPAASDDRVSCLDYKDDNLYEASLPVVFSHMDTYVTVGPSNPKHIWAELGDKLTNRLNVPVLFLGAADPGTSSDVWRQSAENGANFAPDYFPYRRLGATLLHYTARTGVRAILWHQGEGDQGRSTQSYVDNLMVVINKSRQQSGSGSLPWVMSRVSYVRGLTDPNIIGAQNRLINEMPHVYPGPETDALGADSRLPDNVHIAGSGAVRFVELWDRSLNTDFFNRSAPLSLGSFPQITTGYTLTSNRAAGQPISVPYVVSGNPSATSQFSVQLIRDSDGSVVTTLGSGRENPMTVTLPGNLANGVYRAKVVSDNLTSLAGEPFRVGPSAGRIAAPETQAGTWQVWPNPVEREVTIAIPAILTAAKLRGVLSTADGVNKSDAIESTRVENGQLHLTLSSLQTGLYFLHIYDGEQPIQTLKVLKK